MKKLYILILIVYTTSTFAQTPDEALRTAWFHFNGSARNMATGGVMGSLGGDITAAHVNPAGIGLFKTGELILSPGMNLNNNQFNYRGKDTSAQKNNFNYGTMGFVIGTSSVDNSKWTSSAFSLSVNQMANYNNNIQFKGYNNQSSFTEQYLEEVTRDNADTNAVLNNYIFGSSLAFRTFLIDTIRGAAGQVLGYQSLVPISTGVNQEYNSNTRGGYHEIAMALAGNMNDKLYIGGSMTIPIISFKRTLTYSETDATNNSNNDFKNLTYQENFSSKGWGIGAKFGMIYKPQDYWRIGFALHTPQIISMTDQISTSITANTEGYAGIKTESSDNLNSGKAGIRNYSILTPWRAVASASYVFREVNDTRKQRAFISADIEYVNYRGARFYTADEQDVVSKNYLNVVSDEVKDYYKGNVNFRLGGELKFNVFMIRLGGAFYGSPYAASELQANKIIGTAGIGYRNKGIFIDFAYSHCMNKDAVFAYRLNDKPNTFAEQRGTLGNAMMTIGFKF
jgi:hypothetical protein